MPDPTLELDPTAARELLQEAALIISSFKNKLCASGYPFREPPGVSRIIQEIDRLLDPELVKANATVKATSIEIPVFVTR